MSDIFSQDQLRKEKEKENKQLSQREAVDIQRILGEPWGRRFIWKQLSNAAIFQSTYSPNAMQTAFAEGRRSIGLELLAAVNDADPGAFARMQNEYVSEQNKKKEAKEAEQSREE